MNIRSSVKAAVMIAMFPLILNASEGSCGGSTPDTGAQTFKNQYPIVFAHGFGGFDFLVGIPYWYGVDKILSQRGYRVFFPEVSSFNSVEVRATQLAEQVEKILAVTGAEKAHLVGHSMGGLDVRYAASLILGKEKIASVSTIAAPHYGTKIADLLWEAVKFGKYFPGMNELVSSLGGAITNGRIDLPQDVVTAVWNLTKDFTVGGGYNDGPAFNDVVKDLPGVPYYSWAGTSVINLSIDPSDVLLAATSVVFFPEKSDGLVQQSSTRWGKVVNDNLNANHLDETNHLLGDTGVFDPVGFYSSLADRLTQAESSFSTLVASKS